LLSPVEVEITPTQLIVESRNESALFGILVDLRRGERLNSVGAVQISDEINECLSIRDVEF
jgi:hypothetical protein